MSSLAELPELVGFFSYSREDDEAFKGTLSALRDGINRELSAQLGRSKKTFRLWQDQSAIAPGKLWETEIKTAVEQAVFFIPIVTPRSIYSKYCKFEFESFLAREKALGRSDLIFPILYIPVDALEDESQWRDDLVLSTIGRRQYVDWRLLRHLDVQTTAVREQIERLCRKVVEALKEPWVPPEQRRRIEEAKARQQAEDEARRMEAEAKRRAEEERAEVERQAEEERKRAESKAKLEAEARRKATEEAEAERRAEKVKEKEKRERPTAQPSSQVPRPRSAMPEQLEQLEHVPGEQAQREVHRLTPTQKYIAQAAAGAFVTGLIMGTMPRLVFVFLESYFPTLTSGQLYTMSFSTYFIPSLNALGLAAGLVLANRPPRARLEIKLLIIVGAFVTVAVVLYVLDGLNWLQYRFFWIRDLTWIGTPLFVVFAVTKLEGRWKAIPANKFFRGAVGGVIGAALCATLIAIEFQTPKPNLIYLSLVMFFDGIALGALVGFVESVAPAAQASTHSIAAIVPLLNKNT